MATNIRAYRPQLSTDKNYSGSNRGAHGARWVLSYQTHKFFNLNFEFADHPVIEIRIDHHFAEGSGIEFTVHSIDRATRDAIILYTNEQAMELCQARIDHGDPGELKDDEAIMTERIQEILQDALLRWSAIRLIAEPIVLSS